MSNMRNEMREREREKGKEIEREGKGKRERKGERERERERERKRESFNILLGEARELEPKIHRVKIAKQTHSQSSVFPFLFHHHFDSYSRYINHHHDCYY